MPEPYEQVPWGRLVGVGIGAGITAGLLSALVWLGASATGMSPLAAVPGGEPTELSWFNLPLLAILAGLGAGVVAARVRQGPRPRRRFHRLALGVLVVSLVPLVVQPDEVTWATRFVLGGAHVLVYAIVVPALTKLLPEN